MTQAARPPQSPLSRLALALLALVALGATSPGAVGVSVGGDRTSGYYHAKEQLFRTLDDVNPDPRLRELEASIMGAVNDLDIGAMGFGGKVTLIGCKAGATRLFKVDDHIVEQA